MSAAMKTARVSFSTLLCASAAVSATNANAGTTRDIQILQEVIVTATKRSERLQDVPIAVSAITAEDIRTRGFTNYADYLNSLPGVFFQDAGPGNSHIRIRGVSASEGGLPSTTATYFGETVTSVLANFGGKPNLRLVDIDRVEVLRGPQGTLFGASALAGVVRIIPAAPDLENFEANVGVRGFMTAHSDDTSYHAEAAVNIPLVADRLALRLVGYQDDIAGYIDNTFEGHPDVDYGGGFGLPEGFLVVPANPAFTRKDINSEDTWGARAAATWQATDRLKFDLTYATQDVELNSEPFTEPPIGDYQQSRGLDRYEQGGRGERLDIRTLVVNYDWDAVSLVSASNWSKFRRFANQDIAFLGELNFGAPIPWSLRDKSEGNLFTQEVRLQSRGEGPWEWLAGVFYLEQDADLFQFAPDFSCPTCLPVLLADQDFAALVPRQKYFDEEQRSVFAQVGYRLSDQWTIGVGARYLEDKLFGRDVAADGILVGGPSEASEPVDGSVDEFNPSAYLRYEPSDVTTLYLQAARGFRSGTTNQRLPDSCFPEATDVGAAPITDPDTMWNYELGVKSQLAGGALAVNGAVYRQKWEGVQLGNTLECGFSVLINGGDATNDGVEVELVAQPADAWQFNLAASYNNVEFDSAKPGTGFVPGERLPDVPEVNGSAGAQFTFSMGPRWSGFVRADYVYVGEVRLKFGTDLVLTQDAFDTTNLRLSFQRDALGIDLFGRNITDERGVITTGQPNFGGNQFLIRPREVGVELRYSF